MIKKSGLIIIAISLIFILSKLYSNTRVNYTNNLSKTTSIEEVAKLNKTFVHLANDLAKQSTAFSFADEVVPTEMAQVHQKLGKYLTNFSYKKQQSYQMHKKADVFLPKIAKVLALYGIPEDFKYIPIVESGLNPKVTSHKGAGGYWQFMPATARLYGLRVNAEVDERLDFEKSTHAAAKYLKYLYDEFGDWTLVAAAYNVGGGSLKKSIRRQGEDDYFKLRLNAETGSYVYKLVSVKQVIENPEQYGYNI